MIQTHRASPEPTVSSSVRWPRSYYSALQRYKGETGEPTIETLKKSLRTNGRFLHLLRQEQEAYANEVNKERRKVDIFTKQVHNDIRNA